MSRHLDETLLPAQDLQATPRMPRWLALALAGAILALGSFCVQSRLHKPLPARKGQPPAQKTGQADHLPSGQAPTGH